MNKEPQKTRRALHSSVAETLAEIFEAYDRAGTGLISAAAVRRTMDNMSKGNEDFTLEEVNQMFEGLAGDWIDYRAFVMTLSNDWCGPDALHV